MLEGILTETSEICAAFALDTSLGLSSPEIAAMSFEWEDGFHFQLVR